MNSQLRFVLLILALGGIVGAILYLTGQKADRAGNTANQLGKIAVLTQAEKEKQFGKAIEITTPDGFINVEKISVQELIGKKVVLVDFWTYSCINCQRTTPYLNAWYDKYKGQGLEIIGVHTPEFEFEKKYENVKKAVEKFKIKYPVVLDNDYSTWQEYQNQYWPRKYLIDIDGYIVYDHIGEGGYDETESVIRKSLEERAARLDEQGLASEMAEVENPESVDHNMPLSPEIYFGAFRNASFGNGETGQVLEKNFSRPAKLETDKFYLSGRWGVTVEYSENQSANARITMPYQAKKVFLVAGSQTAHKIKIFQDGKLLQEIEISEEGLYRLIEDENYGNHTLEIVIEEPGLQIFTLTFG